MDSSSPLVSPLAIRCTSIGGNSLLAPSERAIGAPSRTRTAASCTAWRIGVFVTTSPAIRSASSTGTALAGQDREGAGEARGVVAARDAPDQRQPQLEGVEAHARRGRPAASAGSPRRPPATPAIRSHHQARRKSRARDQHARQDRQFPVAGLEDAHDFGHDVAEQQPDDAEADHGQQDRIDHRVA